MKSQEEHFQEIECEASSGNVFADLDLENAEEEQVKVDLAWEIRQIIKHKHLTQARAAELIGIDQPKVSALMRGKLDIFSAERLMHFLNALGQDIDIVVKPKPRNRKKAHLSVCFPRYFERQIIPIAAKAG